MPGPAWRVATPEPERPEQQEETRESQRPGRGGKRAEGSTEERGGGEQVIEAKRGSCGRPESEPEESGERSKQGGRARPPQNSDEEYQQSRGSDPLTRHREFPLLGFALIGRDRKDAEEEPGWGGVRLCRFYEIEQVALVRCGTRRE